MGDSIVKLLMRYKARVDVIDEDSWTALHFASAFGYASVVQLLINGAADVNRRSFEGETPLCLAMSYTGSPLVEPPHLEVAQILRNHGGVDDDIARSSRSSGPDTFPGLSAGGVWSGKRSSRHKFQLP